MNAKLKGLSVTFVALLLISLLPLTAFAQDEEVPVPGAVILETQERPRETKDFGIQEYSSMWIPAETFIHRGTPNWAYDHDSYISRTGGNPFFCAAVNLPEGAEVKRIRLYCKDYHPTEEIRLYYYRVRTDNDNSELIKDVKTTGQPGKTTIGFDPYPEHIFDNYHLYLIYVALDATSNDLLFKGVRIQYIRRISDSPATATFPDVPVGHTHFRDIEALAASGITVGYSDGTYRPFQPVTRAQMATFLARALGLYHKDRWD